jgi:hypothetical protein
VFNAQAIDVLRSIFADSCSDACATLVEMDGEDDQCVPAERVPRRVTIRPTRGGPVDDR